MKPASSVVRQFNVPRSVRNAGSSWTSLRLFPPLGPPRSMLSSMSMRPGSNVTSPRSISVAPLGTSGGSTAAMRSPSTTMTPGDRTSPASMSTQRSARRTIGSLTALGSINRSRYAAPESGTCGWRHASTGNDAMTSEYSNCSSRSRVVGHVVERELVAVRDRFFGAREERVVERLDLVHRARHPLARTAPPRWPGTTSAANGSRSANWLGRRASVIAPPPRARACSRRPSRPRPCAGGGTGSLGR